jgi:hypothetical protein
MRTAALGFGCLALSCTRPGSAVPAPPPPPPEEPPSHPTATEPPAASASCSPTDNPLVFACAVDLQEAGPATLTLTAEGAEPRVFRSDAPATRHDLLAWGLLADTTYAFDAGNGATGQLTTGSLPPALEPLTVDVSGELFGIDAVLVFTHCDHFVMLDGSGRVVWYQAAGIYSNYVDGMRWLRSERALLTSRDAVFSGAAGAVRKTDLAGSELLSLDAAELDLYPTHDLDSWGGYTYVLGSLGGGAFAGLGSVEVFAGARSVGQWSLEDTFPGEPGLDVTFINSLSVGETGEIVLSLLSRDTVLGLDGDPASPTFLQRTFHAIGDLSQPNPLPDPDFVPSVDPAFAGQHNPSVHDGSLWVFDNGSQAEARAVQLSLNADGTLGELASYSADQECPYQGGAVPVPGGLLLTCATTDEVLLFRSGEEAPAWRMLAECGVSTGGSSPRAYPVFVE